MKKLFALLTISTLATSMVFGASNEWTNFKNNVKKDIQATNASLKDAVQKDIEASKKAQQDAITAKKTEKINEINKKIADLNKELETIKNAKDMTYTEKSFKTRAIEKQLEYYNNQKADLLK